MQALHDPTLLDELGGELPGNGRPNVGLNDETTQIWTHTRPVESVTQWAQIGN